MMSGGPGGLQDAMPAGIAAVVPAIPCTGEKNGARADHKMPARALGAVGAQEGYEIPKERLTIFYKRIL